jgi:hypothetical protein
MPKEVENIGKSIYFDIEKNYSTPTGTITPVTTNTTQHYPNNTIENINTFDEDNNAAFTNKESTIREEYKALSLAEQKKYRETRQKQIIEEKAKAAMQKALKNNSFSIGKDGKIKKPILINW